MKPTKLLFVALVMSALALFATSCEEKDTTLYPYNVELKLTDPGDLTPDQKLTLETALSLAAKEFGTFELTKSDAEERFRANAPKLSTMIQEQIGKHKKNVVVAFGLYNQQTKNLDFTTNLELLPVL